MKRYQLTKGNEVTFIDLSDSIAEEVIGDYRFSGWEVVEVAEVIQFNTDEAKEDIDMAYDILMRETSELNLEDRISILMDLYIDMFPNREVTMSLTIR
jgi:hypothetical protein